jgi:hypothetical protein
MQRKAIPAANYYSPSPSIKMVIPPSFILLFAVILDNDTLSLLSRASLSFLFFDEGSCSPVPNAKELRLVYDLQLHTSYGGLLWMCG